jgi:hypothetical protein
MTKIKIEGITHKMKNRIQNHGKTWIVINQLGDEYNLQPEHQKLPDYPYCCRVTGQSNFDRRRPR